MLKEVPVNFINIRTFPERSPGVGHTSSTTVQYCVSIAILLSGLLYNIASVIPN